MRYSTLLMSIALAAPVALLACHQSPTDEGNKAVAAQREADEKIAAAEREASQRAAAAQQGADDTAAKARDQVNKETSQAQANANDVIRAAGASILKTRDDIREWAQAKMNALDSDVDSSKTKAQTAPAKAKETFDAALGDVEVKRSAVQSQLAMLDAKSSNELDQFKKNLEKQMDAFSASVSRLKSTL